MALVASGDPGIVDIPGTTGIDAFAVATVNLGASANITASADTGSASLPASAQVAAASLPVIISICQSICQTNPTTGACFANPAPDVTTQLNEGQTPTFAIFVQGNGVVPFDPANNRIFVRFKDATGATRGATSVAVRTQ